MFGSELQSSEQLSPVFCLQSSGQFAILGAGSLWSQWQVQRKDSVSDRSRAGARQLHSSGHAWLLPSCRARTAQRQPEESLLHPDGGLCQSLASKKEPGWNSYKARTPNPRILPKEPGKEFAISGPWLFH